jgi:hypothetical protein
MDRANNNNSSSSNGSQQPVKRPKTCANPNPNPVRAARLRHINNATRALENKTSKVNLNTTNNATSKRGPRRARIVAKRILSTTEDIQNKSTDINKEYSLIISDSIADTYALMQTSLYEEYLEEDGDVIEGDDSILANLGRINRYVDKIAYDFDKLCENELTNIAFNEFKARLLSAQIAITSFNSKILSHKAKKQFFLKSVEDILAGINRMDIDGDGDGDNMGGKPRKTPKKKTPVTKVLPKKPKVPKTPVVKPVKAKKAAKVSAVGSKKSVVKATVPKKK